MNESIQDSLSTKIEPTTSGFGPCKMFDVNSLGSTMGSLINSPIPSFHYVPRNNYTPVKDDSGGRMLVLVLVLTIQAAIWFTLGCFVGSAW